MLAEYSVVFGYSECLAGAGAARCAPTPYFASISKDSSPYRGGEIVGLRKKCLAD